MLSVPDNLERTGENGSVVERKDVSNSNPNPSPQSAEGPVASGHQACGLYHQF